MSGRNGFLSAVIFQVLSIVPFAAHADIGEVGSPNVVVPNATPPAAPAPESAKLTDTVSIQDIRNSIAENNPLYVGSLRQKNFSEFLRNLNPKNVATIYTIASFIPVGAGERQTKNYNDEASATVDALKKAMIDRGIEAENIHTVVKSAPEGDREGQIKVIAP